MKLITINQNDYSKYVLAGTYQINSNDEYEEWQDGWFVTHRIVIRKRISGSIRIKFKSFEEYQAFIADLDAVRAVDGSCLIGLYVNNTGETAAVNAFIRNDMTVQKYRGDNLKVVNEFDLKIEEK